MVLCTILGIFYVQAHLEVHAEGNHRVPCCMLRCVPALVSRAIPALPTRSTICTQWRFCSRSELLIMWYLNKYHPAEEYEIRDVGAVRPDPWKYRHVVSIVRPASGTRHLHPVLSLGIAALILRQYTPFLSLSHRFRCRSLALSGGEFDPSPPGSKNIFENFKIPYCVLVKTQMYINLTSKMRNAHTEYRLMRASVKPESKRRTVCADLSHKPPFHPFYTTF